MNLHQEEHSKECGINSKTITKLLDRFIDRRLELLNHKEINTTLTWPGTVRTAVGEIYR